MDINELKKIVNRKILKVHLERLPENFLREHAKIIKGKVNVPIKQLPEHKNTQGTYRKDAEAKIKNMQTELQDKDKDIESKTNAINMLKTEVKMSIDARHKLEGVVQKLKKEIGQEKNDRNEKERELRQRIEQLEATIKEREDELIENISVILEARIDKERLEKKIQDMRHSIANINKEFNEQPQDTRLQAETDNMAVIHSPNPKKTAPQSALTQNRPEPAAPRGPDSMVYMFSDSSGDSSCDTIDKMAPQSALTQNRPEPAAPRGPDSTVYDMFSDISCDTIDVRLVNRVLAALAPGENPPRLPLSAFKRRNNVAQNYAPSSLTQAGSVVKSKERIFFKTKRLDSRMKNKK